MADTARFVIELDADGTSLESVLSAFKTRFKSDVSELQKTANQLELFGNLQQQADKARDAVLATRERVVQLGQDIAKALGGGGQVGDDLAKQMKTAEKAAADASKEYDRQATKLDSLRASLTKAGVSVGSVSTEQARLAAEIRVATAAQTEQDAKQALGLKTLKEVAPEINRLHAAYNTLASSGTTSVKDLALAQQRLKESVADLRGQVTTLPPAAKSMGASLVDAFKSPLVHALGLTAVIGEVISVLREANAEAKHFAQTTAEIGTITDLSDEKLAGLAEQARSVAREVGVGVNEAIKGLFDLIRSGVPPDNAIEVLKTAAEASKAALADLGSGVKAANLLIESFGASADDLPLLFDKIIAGTKAGGIGLKDFADSAGPLLSVAKAAGISFDDLLATLDVLTDKEGSASQATADLTKIIAKLDTAEAREKLRQLGIEGTTLVSIFTQIGAKGLSLPQILDLGVASTKSAAGIAQLTQNADQLLPALTRVQTAAGTTATALERLQKTSKERSERFHAELEDAQITLGDLLGTGSRLAVLGSDILSGFNRIGGAFRLASDGAIDANKSFAENLATLLNTGQAAKAAEAGLGGAGAALHKAGEDAAFAAQTIAKANENIADFSKKLVEDVQAIQAASSRDIADIQARAAEEIAALSKRKDATLDTAAATLEIETNLAAQRLTIIVKTEAQVTEAINRAATAREAVARRNGDDERKIAGDSAAARIAALGPVLAQYQAHYAALLEQSQGFASKLEANERERLTFNEGIERQLFDIRVSNLSVFDQYVAKAQEADRLIAAAREAGVKGDIEGAKRFTDEAIALAGQLGTVTDKNGNLVVTRLQAQADKTRLLTSAADGYNASLELQAQSAKDGSDATQRAIAEVVPKLQDLQTRVDALKATVAEGLNYKVTLDEGSIRTAQNTLDTLSAPRETTLTVHVVQDGNLTGGGNTPTPPGLNRGGLVKGFARGGPVGKVAGTGNRDTVPALLRAGSYVVRKAASSFYGDGLMSRVVRGYASGGLVTPAEIKKYAENRWGFDPFSTAPIAANGFGPTNTASRFFDPGNITGRTDKGGTTAPETDPRFGFRSGDTFQDAFTRRVISLDTRPIPEALITAANVVAYARDMLNFAGQLGGNSLLGTLGESINSGIAAVERNPNDSTAITGLLQAAQTIGSNTYLFSMWGKTAGSPAAAQRQPEWFLDWLEDRGLVGPGGAPTGGGGLPAGSPLATRTLSPNVSNDFIRRFFTKALPAAGPPPLALQLAGLKGRSAPGFARPFAAGGASSDTVPAMLTPGEFVVRKSAVDHFGPDFLDAINQMRVSPGALRSMLSPRAPIARFATGGPVGVTAGATILPAQGSTTPAAPGGVTNNYAFTFALDSAALINPDRLRPAFVALADEFQRKTR